MSVWTILYGWGWEWVGEYRLGGWEWVGECRLGGWEWESVALGGWEWGNGVGGTEWVGWEWVGWEWVGSGERVNQSILR